jgi:hypothetical protein
MLKGQQKALNRMYGGRKAKQLWALIGTIGTVRAWEVTYGQNGWHPHFHILIFCQPVQCLDSLQAAFYDLWANSCRIGGLGVPSREHGVKLDDGSHAAAYASKGVWGLDHEMTKGHIKKASQGGFSPFDLLRAYLYGDKQAGALFVEFALAFFGKRQLYWSPGLKSKLSVEDVPDCEILADNLPDDVILGRLSTDQWRLILKHDKRGQVLEYARLGWSHVETFLADLAV